MAIKSTDLTHGVPRHEWDEHGDYTKLDTCGIREGGRIQVITRIGESLMATIFERTDYERGAMHDWKISGQDEGDSRVALSHTHPNAVGSSFMDRSVILKLGNELCVSEWDAIKRPASLGKIVHMELDSPLEVAQSDVARPEIVVELPMTIEGPVAIAA